MNKSAIKNYAIWARVQLIEAVKQKAYEYEISDGENGAELDAIGGKPLTAQQKQQRKQLVVQIRQKGYTQVMEEAAYTWFNRFIALRFMEVNGYLPSKIRIFTDENGAFKPEIMKEAATVELDGLDRSKVFELLDNQANEELYKYLIITQCNALNAGLPYMFEKLANWTELLFPANLLRSDSVIAQMVQLIPEDDWKDAVQIIGWLYQYYNDERKNEVINIYKGTVKKEDIPAATQLFTTDWVVRYMVDNSLGRYWIERHPESKLAEKLEFFAMPKNGKMKQINEPIKPEELKFLDPCMGSGHILVYAFDVLMEIYKESGYSERDAAALIVQNNLFGLDIDDRASQLAYFAVMMKARSIDRRFLTRGIGAKVFAIQESNQIELTNFAKLTENETMDDISSYLIDLFRDAKELGSIITVEPRDYDGYIAYLDGCNEQGQLSTDETGWLEKISPMLKALARQAKLLSERYSVVCTNPPYLNKMEGRLKAFVTEKYKDYSGDLFSVFIYRNLMLCKQNGYCGYMTPFVWMFIKTYEKLRKFIIANKSISTLVQMEYSAFEEATVPICAFVLKNGKETEKGLYFKLSDFKGGMEVQKQKVLEALTDKDCGYFYEDEQSNFSKIPGSPVAYWVSETLRESFGKYPCVSQIAPPKQGLATADNDRFLRKWYEVSFLCIGFGCSNCIEASRRKTRWFPYNKGGAFRRWYGNRDYVVNWENDGFEIKNFRDENGRIRSRPQNLQYYFRSAITWSDITSASFSGRACEKGFMFDIKGSSGFPPKERMYFILGFLNSSVSQMCIKILNPTITTQVGDMARIPVIESSSDEPLVNSTVSENILLSKTDWDSYETSWDFKRNPLV